MLGEKCQASNSINIDDAGLIIVLIGKIFIGILFLGSLFALSLPAFFQDFGDAEIIVLGEVHDNPHAHLVQAEFLRKISPKAVVFEMLGPIEGMAANGVDRTDLDAIAEVSRWEESGWPPFDLYAPVFEAIGNAGILGAAIPDFLVSLAVSSSASDVFGGNGDRFGLHLPLPPEQRKDRKNLQFAVHCEAIPRALTSGLVEAQRLRDAVFAKVTLDALNRYGAPVVLIAGFGHARLDWGVPAAIKTANPNLNVFSISIMESETDAPFDQVVIVPSVERPNPCQDLNL